MRIDEDTRIHENYFKRLMQSQQPMTKLDSYGDPRLIPFGAFFRSSGLDELPQLFNILRGEMSWVGPRPCTPNEYEDYLPWQKQRFQALPGLTGLWQVSGKNQTTFNEMIQLDIAYAHKQSWHFDLLILLRTAPVVLGQVIEMIGNKFRRAERSSESSTAQTQPRASIPKRAAGEVVRVAERATHNQRNAT